MRGEGTQVLLNALLIADVRIDFVKDRELGMVRCRNVQAALAEQGKKSDGFQGNCLTAGVRTGDDEHCKVLADADIDRNHFFRVNERVASFFDADAALLIEIRFRTAVKQRELCACKDKIEFG